MICSCGNVDMIDKGNLNPDVLWVEMKIKQLKFDVSLFYSVTGMFSMDYGERNRQIINNLKNIAGENKDKKLMILGDFNAHIGILGEQEINKNGEEVMKLMEEAGLIMLNMDDECTGEIT